MIRKNLITKKSNKLLIFLNDTSKKFVRVNKYFIWNKKKKMKKSNVRSILFAFLFVLSLSACLYVNLAALNTVSSSDTDKAEQYDYPKGDEETDASIIEVELLKKLIEQGASKLPTPDIQ